MKSKKRENHPKSTKKKKERNESRREEQKAKKRQNVLEGQRFAANVTKQIIIIEVTKTSFLFSSLRAYC